MSSMIAWLDELARRDTRVRAVLRRSLAFEPGLHIPAYPYVEPFVGATERPWRRSVLYLVAGLWAAHWREGRRGEAAVSLARAAAAHQIATGSASTEHRFISLLDAADEQLPHRLRQMVALLKDHALDFELLLRDLLGWHAVDRRIQRQWAREFYRERLPTQPLDTSNSEVSA